MKITRSQLQRIIQEELQQIVNEQMASTQAPSAATDQDTLDLRAARARSISRGEIGPPRDPDLEWDLPSWERDPKLNALRMATLTPEDRASWLAAEYMNADPIGADRASRRVRGMISAAEIAADESAGTPRGVGTPRGPYPMDESLIRNLTEAVLEKLIKR